MSIAEKTGRVPDLSRVPRVDAVGVEERAAELARRSIKKEAKRAGIRLAVRMIDLTTLEGKTLDVRWRFASDTSSGGPGWSVDDVRLDAPALICVNCDDLDDDGFCPAPTGDDCDDTDPAVHPGAPEVCDGVANDCNNPAWPALPAAELDVDGDGLSACNGDCNGSNGTVGPQAPELCDGLDNDCDGLLDEGASCDASCDAADWTMTSASTAFSESTPKLAYLKYPSIPRLPMQEHHTQRRASRPHARARAMPSPQAKSSSVDASMSRTKSGRHQP